MSGVTNEEVLRAVNASRDTTTAQIGGLKAAVDHLAEAIQAHEQRISALEDLSANGGMSSAYRGQQLAQADTDVRELIAEFKNEKARSAAKSQLKLEAEAAEAKAAVASESRRKAITWALGALFVASQILTIWKGLR